MPTLQHSADIRAEREAVFALVSRVEEFVDYSDFIDTIVRLDDARYLWRVRIAGVPLRFDIVITQSCAPESFAWRSVSGVSAWGHFHFAPLQGGTRIHLSLNYRLDNRLLERTVQLAAKPMLRRLSRDIIAQLECRLANSPKAD
ncbi:SRPBCC family protein [Halomonas sp. Bachu 37]|uniref:SRPBCC family protein n=1 Tax=Halomonas kashgarensis TaxID=3084920 RepID=UPI003217A537